MRCFIAIELDNKTRALLTNIQRLFADKGVKGTFTREENLHVTLKFLGEVDHSIYQRLCEVLIKTAQRHQSFVLTLDGIGKFNKGNKKILWAGFSKNNTLLDLHKDIEDELGIMMDLEKERHYTPHITLVRETVLDDEEIKKLDINKIVGYSFVVSGISLMESTRVNGKLTYVQRACESFSK